MCRKHDHHVDEVRYSGGMVDALAIFAGGVCPEVAIKPLKKNAVIVSSFYNYFTNINITLHL